MPGTDELPIPVRQALKEIVHYMVFHPDAKDTSTGIRDWWLPARREEYSLAQVEQAIEILVKWGWLTEQRLAEQTVIYGPSQKGVEQGRQYLKGKTIRDQ